MTNSISDWKALAMLTEGDVELPVYLIYKACIAFAINGNSHSAELSLSHEFTQLLKARRFIKEENFRDAANLLDNYFLESEHDFFFELSGDRDYLRALIAHRTNQPTLAEMYFKEAARQHSKGKDEHRKLRSLINQHIVTADLTTHLTGEIFFLKQRAFSANFFDLVGNIEKAAANVWLHEGNYFEAVRSAKAAVDSYQIDGCPEDRTVALTLLAIAQVLDGRHAEAVMTQNSIHIKGGKVSSYLLILNSLLDGAKPDIPPGHPLFGAPFNLKPKIKDNSILGKVLTVLKSSPASRDELITKVWGQQAIDPSYNSRLYTAIKDLRTKHGISISFDGEQYKIA